MAPPAPPKTMVVNPYLKKGPAGGGAAKPPMAAAAAAGAGTKKTGMGSSAAIRRPPPSGAVSRPPAAAAPAAAVAVPSRRPQPQQPQQQRPVGASQRPTAPNRIISSTGPRISTSTTSAGTGTGTIASAGVAVPPTSLKAQLRQQIAELKRAKLLKKQAAEQQRRRQQQAAEEAARAKAQALLDQRRAREAEAAKKANKENDQKKETKKGREEGEDEPAPTEEGGRIETQVEKVEEMEVEAARVKPTGSSVPPATARQPPPSSSFAGAGSPAPEARQHQRQYYGQPPEPGPAPTPTETMGPPPVPPSHRPPDYDRTHPHSQPPGPVMGAPLHSKTPSSLSFPAKEVTPSPYTYGVAAAGARYSSTPYASHQQQQQQQQHMYSHTRAELAPASPNKALSFGSPPKAAGGRGGNPLTKQEKEWESPVDHGAIIENIFREMGEFESRRGGAGDDSSHGSFHMDISPIKIEGLADSPPREAEAGPTTASSVGLDMPRLPEKARAAADPGIEAKGNSGIGKERPQEQAAAPPPPLTAAHRHPAGPWMSPHLGAATGGSAGPIPPLPSASAYFAAYTPQQFPFGFPPHAYSYPLPNAVPSPAQVPAHATPAAPSSLNIKQQQQQQQQQNVLSMASPFGAWASATATPGRVASAAQSATPSTSAARTGTPTSGMNPSKTSNTKKTGATGSSPRPSPAKKSATTILHERIMVAPSPFAVSYEVVKNPIIITKDIGGSFGIDMRQETRSVLVDSQDGQNSSGSTKKRRRRVYFCAMLAVKTERQNARKDAAKQGSDILRPGDIVLSVDGCATGGLPFKNAAALFAAAKTPAKGDESRAIQCALTVARPKLVAPGSKPTVVCSGPQAQKVPLVLGNGVIVSGDFSEIELRALIDGLKSIRRYGDPLLQTNHGATLSFLKGLLTHPTIGRDLSRRDMNSIIAKLSFTKARIVLSMNAAAIKHFTEQWEKECERASKDSIGGHVDAELKLMSDAKRSTLRLLPRPDKGCKCGAEDHRFAHDERCLLYRDIIPHVKPQDLEPFKASSKKMRSRKAAEAEIDSAIVSALQERQSQAKRDQEDEFQEAMYVDLMERTQVKKLKTAIFAPGLLSVAIISAVATLMEQRSSSQVVESNESDDDSDDDDDIPLTALSSSSKPPAKKQKVEVTAKNLYPSFATVAEILLHISKTWGHLLKDYESNAEYAWHLKLGGLDSGESLDQYRRNPRRAQSLSFENIQFLLDDAMVSGLKSPPPAAVDTPVVAPTTGTGTSSTPPSSSNATAGATTEAPALANQHTMDELTIALLASQECTGVWDEIQALVTAEVLLIDRDGTVVLRQDWHDNVGASILLDGREKGWFKEYDPGNSFCLHDSVRSLVPDIWVRRDNGWAFADSKLEDGVEFNENEYLDIKREYIRDYGSHFDQIDGVGKFGGATE